MSHLHTAWPWPDPSGAPRVDPRLLEPVRCRVLRAFCVGGARVEPGEIVELTRFDAQSMRALGRVEIL